jgi:hypothetical protein
MSDNSQLATPNKSHFIPSRSIARVAVTIIFTIIVPSGRTQTDHQQYAVVARVDAKNAGLTPNDLVVRVEHMSVPAMAIKAYPEIPRNIAIVLDAGPDQARILSKEKELAIALINGLSDGGTSFTIAKAGTSPETLAPTQNRSVAVEDVRGIKGDKGERTSVAIYDAIGSAIRQISLVPGLRVVIFIGEGNDGGSRLGYAELRNLAESNQIAFFAALVANHSLRGTKSILRYGWDLRELSGDTAGIFLENQKTSKATRQLSESVARLRLVIFKIPFPQSGRYKLSASSTRNKRFKAQKRIVIP